MLPDFRSLAEQTLLLLTNCGQVLVLTLLAGWGFTLTLLPHRFALRWIIMAPIVGMAVLTIIGLPLSLSGVPVKSFLPWTIVALSAFSVGATAVLWRSHRLFRGQRAFSYLRSRGLRHLTLGSLVIVLSAYLMTAQYRTDVRDYWGSGDFAAYWGTSDYLLDNGADPATYAGQTRFKSPDIYDHLTFHARLGCMIFLAEVAGAFDAAHLYRAINPILVVLMWQLVALGALWLESIRCRAFWPLVILACHPLLYFLLYFSYLSQATGVVLTLAGFLIANAIVRSAEAPSNARRSALGAGMLLGAALLHHPSMPPFTAAIGGALFLKTWLTPPEHRRWSILWWVGAALLGSTFYYLPATWRELTSLGTNLRGWNWQRPIGFSEIAGLRTVLGYGLPSPLATSRSWTLEIVGATSLLGGAALILFHRRDRWVVGTLAGVTALLVATTLLKVFQHVPNATHSFVKAISLFSTVLVLACFAAWTHVFERLPKFGARVAVALVLLVWIPCELRALRFGSYQGPRFRESLVDLTRRQTARGAHVWLAFWPPNDATVWLNIKETLVTQPTFPIVRNVDFLNPVLDGSAPTVKISHVSQANRLPVIDSAPSYVVTEVAPETRARSK